jgi:hypothetical protein
MSTGTPSAPTPRWIVVSRLVGATLICLLVLAITLPNLGRPDFSDPASYKIKYGWPDALCIAIIVAPLLLVFIGATRSRATEAVGWVLLLIVLALRFVS